MTKLRGSSLKKPPWLRVPLPGAGAFAEVKTRLRKNGLVTVCTEASCPNLAECWAHGTLTVMILGDVCTRNCRFCDVRHAGDAEPGTVCGPPDPDEPEKVARVLGELGVRYAVLTSVTRDDLPDGGAAHWAAVIQAVSAACPAVEALVPDFGGKLDAVDVVLAAAPTVFAHNIETVRSLSPEIRPMADYDRSLVVLAHAAASGIPVKSSLLLGLGETHEEILVTLWDLRAAGVARVTLGQYLAPSRAHVAVKRFLSPGEFDMLRQEALEMGFSAVHSGPLVRSSYHAHTMAGPCGSSR
ncbi:MAG: lipoyl synthase [Deltaproteobacteria bacterium HGW-Deltaproteobacteria-22]|nr:MAG: lipoyl synthase [Deltaproteobacteria bacterium HGW-Deltaproteobacteria-22]